MTKKAPKNNVLRSAPFELRADPEGDGFTLEGYAAVFDTPTRIDSWEGRFDETIARGAFAKTISERKPVLQWDHGNDAATGSVPIGAIESLREDSEGLFVSARLHDNARVEPIRHAIESGAIDGMSFRFQVVRDDWEDARSGDLDSVPTRIIREVILHECGPVCFPAYESTSVGVRSLLTDLDDEQRLRLMAELRDDLPSTDAASDGTSDGNADAATSGTSENTNRTATATRLAIHRSLRSETQ